MVGAPSFLCLAWYAAFGATLVATAAPLPCLLPVPLPVPRVPLALLLALLYFVFICARNTSGGRGLCQSGQLLMLCMVCLYVYAVYVWCFVFVL